MTSEEAALVRDGAAAALGIRVADEALARIDRFLDILAVWRRTVRLTGERDRKTILVRHVVDSLAAVVRLPPTGRVIDVGSGAGFPGIILGCVRPDLELVLIEARRRRASFLAEAIRTIPLPRARVICSRAEEVEPSLRGSGDVVITRAVRADIFLALAEQLVAPTGTAMAMQTPGAVAAAAATGAAHRFRLSDVHAYSLPDGRRRALLAYVRA